MPRLTYLAGVALLLVAGAFLLTDHLLTPPPGVTEANAQRIKPGMSREQVERVLGGPPLLEGAELGAGQHGLWAGDAGFVSVTFDSFGRAAAAWFTPRSWRACCTGPGGCERKQHRPGWRTRHRPSPE